ncbi:hypothetical protein ACFVT5_13425 [Streptomyces sp. NPDC058001]|uniref:hypothetical protein n=1 Tax=Streptomyces sp. NPDC058001 TaxID=3346300 RepID=UPI0036E60861
MPEVLYGVLGALGGALITALGAYWGPLQMQRATLRAQRQEALEQGTRADRAQAEARKEERVERIILVRSALRDWNDFLYRALQDLELGRRLNAEDFDVALARVQGTAHAAVDAMLRDGLWIGQSAYGYPLRDPLAQDGRPLPLVYLEAASRRIRQEAVGESRVTPDVVDELRSGLDYIQDARGQLAARMLNQIEVITATPPPSPDRPSN